MPATAHRRPLDLVYYEGCKEAQATLREKALKTGFGRRYLKLGLGWSKVTPRPQRFA